MRKRICLPGIVCSLLLYLTVTFNAVVIGNESAASVMIPATGDVTSVIALTLAGVAAVGGLLLRKSK